MGAGACTPHAPPHAPRMVSPAPCGRASQALPDAPPTKVARLDPDMDALRARVRALEAENEALRAAIAAGRVCPSCEAAASAQVESRPGRDWAQTDAARAAFNAALLASEPRRRWPESGV